MAFFRKIAAGLVKSDITKFVGEIGNVFFNIETGQMYLSDGVTPGGIPITMGGGGGFVPGETWCARNASGLTLTFEVSTSCWNDSWWMVDSCMARTGEQGMPPGLL